MNIGTGRTRRAAATAIAIAAVALIAASGGSRLVGTARAAGSTTVRGVTVQHAPLTGTINWSNQTMEIPTGCWRGEPERVLGPFQATAGHGNTIYYWYVRGIAGAKPADDRTIVLATDNWRFETTSYERATDTVMMTKSDGSRERRQGSPVWGVLAVQAPAIILQAQDPRRFVDPDLLPSVTLPNGTTWTMDRAYKANREWVANTTTLRFGATDREVTSEPTGANSDANGRVWNGADNPGSFPPEVTENVLLSGRPYQGTFKITVPAYTADLRRGSVFFDPAAIAATTAMTDVTLLEGTSTVHGMTVAYGSNSKTVENSYTAIVYRTAAGSIIVDPPDPTPRVLRYAIMYVPGDSKFIPDNVRESGGK